jgi:integrating conjugative element protein (TIGR03757 family)
LFTVHPLPSHPDFLVAVGLALTLAATPSARAEVVSTIEIFAAADAPVTQTSIESQTSVSVAVHAIDAFAELQSTLSRDLPVEPEAAKALALARIERLGADRMEHLKTAAIGLAKAYQYRLDRYPAVVFDGRAVVYGISDLAEALAMYASWREEQGQ